jgi:hypothetical protein
LKLKEDQRIGASQRPPPQDPAPWKPAGEVGVVALARRRLIQEEAEMRLIILIILIVGALLSWP